MKEVIIIDKKQLTIDDVIKVAYRQARVSLSQKSIKKINGGRDFIEKIIDKGETIYGITTGFGKFKNITISRNKVKELQKNLIMSHSIGVGKPFSEEVVRAAILIRINSLAFGNSGIKLETLQTLVDLLNKNIYPYVPSQGSVGCSGDLAPLSHIALILIGKGEVFENEKRVNSLNILKKSKINPIFLEAKEGLALNNGTAVMTAIATLNINRAIELSKLTDISAAMSLESLMGTLTAFHKSIQRLRPYKGQRETASNIRQICQKSEIIRSHQHCHRVQDSYSLRCVPQVHGAAKDAIEYCKKIIEIEINSVTDNPLLFPEEKMVRPGGNFHGEPIALVMDFLSMALSELGNISERRTFKLLDPDISEGLPAFLISKDKAGLDSGYMIAQYTAASLVAENKVLAHPISVDSIPTSADQEDHVSFGTTAARKTAEIIKNLEKIIAIELMCTAQALDFRKPLKPGLGTATAYRTIRQVVPNLTTDRVLYKDLEKIIKLVEENKIVKNVEKIIGKLN